MANSTQTDFNFMNNVEVSIDCFISLNAWVPCDLFSLWQTEPHTLMSTTYQRDTTKCDSLPLDNTCKKSATLPPC